MKTNQLNKGNLRHLMYIENKEVYIDGVNAHIGWVEFSKTGKTVKYKGLEFQKIKGGGVRGNYYETTSGTEYWISGVKKRGSNIHWAEGAKLVIDDDALEEYRKIKSK